MLTINFWDREITIRGLLFDFPHFGVAKKPHLTALNCTFLGERTIVETAFNTLAFPCYLTCGLLLSCTALHWCANILFLSILNLGSPVAFHSLYTPSSAPSLVFTLVNLPVFLSFYLVSPRERVSIIRLGVHDLLQKGEHSISHTNSVNSAHVNNS